MSGESLISLGKLETNEDISGLITKYWSEWDGFRDPVIGRWKEIEAYRHATDVTELPNVTSSFTHTTHLPLTGSIGQDLEAILMQVVMPHQDYFTFEDSGLTPVARETRLAIIKYAKNRTAINGMRDIVKKLIKDLVNKGNCFSMAKHVADENGYTGAKPVRISPYDIVFNPTASSFAASPKIIREIIDLGSLKRRAMAGEFDIDYVQEIISKRVTYSGKSNKAERASQYVPRGYGTYEQYIQSGEIEVLWFYGDIFDAYTGELHESKIYAVTDMEYIIRDDTIKTRSGQPNIFKSGWEDLEDNLWSCGPLEDIIGLNYQVNHRENAKSEGLDRLIYPDRVHMGDVEEIFDDETGQVTYITDEGGAVQDIPINSQFLGFDLHIDRLNFAARQAARLPGDLVGFRSQGEKTLGEVTALTEGGMRGFVDKAAEFERTTIEPHLKALVELAFDNFQGIERIKVRTDDGLIESLQLNKEDFASEGALIPMGSRRFARKNQLLTSLTQLSATPLAQLAATHISGKKAGKLIEELLEIEETGLVEEFAQIKEQGEAQKMMNQIDQANAMDSAMPSAEEMSIDQELQNLG